jgi:hypothetical protein
MESGINRIHKRFENVFINMFPSFKGLDKYKN